MLCKGTGAVLFLVMVNGRYQYPVIILLRVPSAAVLYLKTCSPILGFSESDGGIGPHGEPVGFGGVISRRQKAPHMTRLKKSSYGKTPDGYPIHINLRDGPVFSGLRIQAHGRTIRDKEEFAERGHGDKIFLIHIPGSVSGEPYHAVVGMIIDPAAAVGTEHGGDVIKTAHNGTIFALGQFQVKPQIERHLSKDNRRSGFSN
jgi:hypothetical protein